MNISLGLWNDIGKLIRLASEQLYSPGDDKSPVGVD
jgi:hypothetical protein